MNWIQSLGGGEGIGAIVAAVAVLAGLFPRLRKSEKAATSAATSAAKVVQEVSPNSGGSMRDAIMRMELQQKAISDDVKALRMEANITHVDFAARISNIEKDVARCQCEPTRH